MKRQVATFYVGHNVAGRPKWGSADVARAMVKVGVPSFTAYPAVGFWLGEQEASTVVLVVGMSPLVAADVRRVLERELQQEEVLCTLGEVELA